MKDVISSIAIQVEPRIEGGNKEVIRVVDAVIDYIKSTGLHYYVGPCETAVEGDYETLMKIIHEAQLICIKEGANRVTSLVKINYGPGTGVLTIDEKVTKHHI